MSIKFTILGCGSSMGVPRPDGVWGNCNPNEKKNYRTRCSALISTHNTNTLIDTSPDLRNQLYSAKCINIDAVCATDNDIFALLHKMELLLKSVRKRNVIGILAGDITSRSLFYPFIKGNCKSCVFLMYNLHTGVSLLILP